MAVFRKIYSWLTKASYETPAGDDVVELAALPTFQQAHELTQLLNNIGIIATTFGSTGNNEAYGQIDASAAQFGFAGYRVMVRGDGLEQARQVLADYEEDLRGRAD